MTLISREIDPSHGNERFGLLVLSEIEVVVMVRSSYSIFLACRYLLLRILILISVTGCQHKVATSGGTSIPQVSEIAAIKAIRLPGDLSNPVYNDLRFAEAVFSSYERNSFRPFWLERNIPSEKADFMVEIIRSARRYGLLPQHYHSNDLPYLVLETSDSAKMQRLDAVLTDAFLSMAHDLRVGRSTGKNTSVPDSTKVANLLDSIQTSNVKAVLEAQEPSYEGYISLKAALNEMLDTIHVSDQRLLMNGITDDLNGIHRKIQTIEINLERWRNEQASLGQTYAWINIPAYMFYVVEDRNVVMESRIVVGKPANQTPQFSSNIECFTIFPYWYVPRKIAVQEYLPLIRKDTTFITRNNFDVLDRKGNVQKLSAIDWTKLTANNFPYTLRQREGSENSLGIIKFVFDNPYAVFLHDTNAKRLFKNKMRAYSHGCIRLEKAFEFAHYLVDGRSKISAQTLDKYLKDEKRITISLLPAVPIHIRYFTCEVRDGELKFYDDIYNKDRTIIRKLYNTNPF